jgi:predicted nucleic acid-binding protein
MAINPWLTDNFVDSCAFDPKYDPEDKAATEIFRLHQEKDLSIIIAHSTQKEIEHPNTPSWVKKEAGGLIYTLPATLISEEKALLQKIERTLAGSGKRENIIQDARHIFEAQKYGSYFVTTDHRLLNKTYKIQKLCRVKIILPSEFLIIVQDHIREESQLCAQTTGNMNCCSVTPPQRHDVQIVSYKGYHIKPASRQLPNSLRWTTSLTIWINKGYEIVERQFFAANTFEREEEAIRACVEFGQQIIDGRIPNCTVTDL